MSNTTLKLQPSFPPSIAGVGVRLDKTPTLWKLALDVSALPFQPNWNPVPGDGIAIWDGSSYFAVLLPVLILTPNPPVIYDNVPIGTAIGTLSVFGGVGTSAYTLTNDAGGRFVISGNQLLTNAALGVGNYAISILADNGAGTHLTLNTSVSVLHFISPDITGGSGLNYWFNGLPQPGMKQVSTDGGTLQFWFNGLPINAVFK